MPFRSQAQRRYLYSQKPRIAAEFAAKTPKNAKLPERVKNKKKPKVAVDNKLKGSYGETTIQKGKPTIIKINVKKHNGNKAELADTIKHELMHAKHPNMHEKTVYKKVPKNIPPKEQDKLIAKLRMKKLNYKTGAVKRKLKIGPVKTSPGELISKSRAVSQRMRVGMAGM